MESMSLELKSINTIRTLAMDAVQRANSGHPGAPPGLPRGTPGMPRGSPGLPRGCPGHPP